MLKEPKFKLKNIKEKTQSGYKIYKNNSEFEFVEALTAVEALEKSSIKTPIKIEKVGIVKKAVFSDEELILKND